MAGRILSLSLLCGLVAYGQAPTTIVGPVLTATGNPYSGSFTVQSQVQTSYGVSITGTVNTVFVNAGAITPFTLIPNDSSVPNLSSYAVTFANGDKWVCIVTTVPAPVSTTATLNSTNSIIVASATGIVVGQLVTGAGIPSNTTVTGISGTTVTLSASATLNASGVAVSFMTTIPFTQVCSPNAIPPNQSQAIAPSQILPYQLPGFYIGTTTAGTVQWVPGTNSAVTLTGDTTGTGTTSITTTTGKVDGVSYPASPALNTIPVVTSTATGGAVTYTATNGSGSVVRSNSPALVTPDLGTPSAINLSNANVSGLSIGSLSGTLQAVQEPAHTGDVTNTAGLLAMTVALVGGSTAAEVHSGPTLNGTAAPPGGVTTTGPVANGAIGIWNGPTGSGTWNDLSGGNPLGLNQFSLANTTLQTWGYQFVASSKSIGTITNANLFPNPYSSGSTEQVVNPLLTPTGSAVTGWVLAGGAATSMVFNQGAGDLKTGNSILLPNSAATATTVALTVQPNTWQSLNFFYSGAVVDNGYQINVLDASNSNAVIFSTNQQLVTSSGVFIPNTSRAGIFITPSNCTSLKIQFVGDAGSVNTYIALVSLQPVIPLTVSLTMRHDATNLHTYFLEDVYLDESTPTGTSYQDLRWLFLFNDGTDNLRAIFNLGGLDGSNYFADWGISPTIGEWHNVSFTVFPQQWIYAGLWVPPYGNANVRMYYDGAYVGDLTPNFPNLPFNYIYPSLQGLDHILVGCNLGGGTPGPRECSDVSISAIDIQQAKLDDADHVALAGCAKRDLIALGQTPAASWSAPAVCPTGQTRVSSGLGTAVSPAGQVSIGQPDGINDQMSFTVPPLFNGGILTPTPLPTVLCEATIFGAGSADCSSSLKTISNYYSGVLQVTTTGTPAGGPFYLFIVTVPSGTYTAAPACAINALDNTSGLALPNVTYDYADSTVIALKFFLGQSAALTTGHNIIAQWHCDKN